MIRLSLSFIIFALVFVYECSAKESPFNSAAFIMRGGSVSKRKGDYPNKEVKVDKSDIVPTTNVYELTRPHNTDDSIVFISPQTMKRLGVKKGDYVQLKGKKQKTSVVRVHSDKNIPDGNVQASAVLHKNIRVFTSDNVTMTKVRELQNATKVEVTPLVNGFQESDGDVMDLLKPYFKGENRPLVLDNTFIVYRMDNKTNQPRGFEFKVTGIEIGDLESPSQCFVGPSTEILCDITAPEEDTSMNEIGYDDIGGCQGQLASIRELVELPLRHPEVFSHIGIPPPRGVLLYGPSGTGKTTLARAVAAETGAYIVVLNGPEIMSKQAGESESNLRKAFEDAEKNAPAIIFIDEIDSLAPKRDKVGGETERRVVSQLLTLFDGIKRSSNVVVIAATNRPNVLDPALRRFGRFDREINIAQPDEAGRLEILRIKTRNMKLSPNCDLKRVARDTHGYVGADLSAVCMEAAFRAIREILPHVDIDAEEGTLDPALLASIELRNEHFAQAVQATNPSSLRESIAEVPNTKWEDIGGLEDVKQELKELVQLPVEYGHLYEKFGMSSSKGVLFYGPPGCGKTLLAKAIANEAGANFISIKGPELLDAHIGESEANVRALFDKARAASPCILFFDEMDSIAKARNGGKGGSGLGDNVINQILTEIDSIESKKSVFIIGATNRPDILDPSIMRPGHLDQLVYIPLPDFESRLSIFKANLRKCPVDPSVNVTKLAMATDGFSGADITEICQRAAKNAIREDIAADVANAKDGLLPDESGQPAAGAREGVRVISKEHFEEAMSRARRSVSEQQIEQYKQFMTKQRADANSARGFSFEQAASAADGADAASAEEDEGDLYA